MLKKFLLLGLMTVYFLALSTPVQAETNPFPTTRPNALPNAFSDVSQYHWAVAWINQLYNEGVTGGCGTSPLRYCPDTTVTRAQMAVFLVRTIHGADYIPPAAKTIFGDVPADYWANRWINQLYADGVTGGCNTNPLLFCPETSVSRGQMAVFLLRATHGSGYEPPASGNIFSDVPANYWAKNWINALYSEGFTGGCANNPLNYCPDTFVNRSQMSVFLLRAIHGTAYTPPAIDLVGPTIAGCPIFPMDNIWNTPIDDMPVHPRSAQWVTSLGGSTNFHMDFSSGTYQGGPIGFPYNVVSGSAVPNYYPVFLYDEESEPGPYPIPLNPLREYADDHHLIVLNTDNCNLYEIHDSSFNGSNWSGDSGAIWDLNSNALRPAGWTSANAAGLPILPGLVRYDEILDGVINHALRFTANDTNSYIWPARHLSGGQPGVLTNIPPMGARFRLKASYDISGFPAQMQVILQAMKTYGIILSDEGVSWTVSGTPDPRWDRPTIHTLDVLTGNDFEAVDESSLIVNINSGQAK